MRCLHCGRELALLKRLTGGEFCSDEHRLQYQRDYSQLALSRLLQAKPPLENDGNGEELVGETESNAASRAEMESAPGNQSGATPPRRRLPMADQSRSGSSATQRDVRGNLPPAKERPALAEPVSTPPVAARSKQPAQVAGSRTPAALPEATPRPTQSNLPVPVSRGSVPAALPASQTKQEQPATLRQGGTSLPAGRAPAALPAAPPAVARELGKIASPARRIPAALPAPAALQPGALQNEEVAAPAAPVTAQPFGRGQVRKLDAPQTTSLRSSQDSAPAPLGAPQRESPRAAKQDFSAKVIDAEAIAAGLPPTPPRTRFGPRLPGLTRATNSTAGLVRNTKKLAEEMKPQQRARVFRTENIDFSGTAHLIKLAMGIAANGRPEPASASLSIPASLRLPAANPRAWVAAASVFTSQLVETGSLTRLSFLPAELEEDDLDSPPSQSSRDRPRRVSAESQRTPKTEVSDDQLARKPRSRPGDAATAGLCALGSQLNNHTGTKVQTVETLGELAEPGGLATLAHSVGTNAKAANEETIALEQDYTELVAVAVASDQMTAAVSSTSVPPLSRQLIPMSINMSRTGAAVSHREFVSSLVSLGEVPGPSNRAFPMRPVLSLVPDHHDPRTQPTSVDGSVNPVNETPIVAEPHEIEQPNELAPALHHKQSKAERRRNKEKKKHEQYRAQEPTPTGTVKAAKPLVSQPSPDSTDDSIDDSIAVSTGESIATKIYTTDTMEPESPPDAEAAHSHSRDARRPKDRSLPKPLNAPATSVDLKSARETAPWLWIAAGIALLGLIGGGLNLYFGQPKKPPIVVASPAPLPWTELDAGRKRQIALPPLPLSGPDYLVEIQSALAEKPIGWAFRVNGAASFYIEKLSLRKQAGQQSVVAVHTLMQNGNESARAETAVNLGADYDSGKVRKIRFEASGNRFTTFVDDKKIDDWRDSRLTSGGSGIYQDETTNAPAKERFEVSSLGNGKDDAKNDQKSSSTKK